LPREGRRDSENDLSAAGRRVGAADWDAFNRRRENVAGGIRLRLPKKIAPLVGAGRNLGDPLPLVEPFDLALLRRCRQRELEAARES